MNWLVNSAFGLIAPFHHTMGRSLMKSHRLMQELPPLRQQPPKRTNQLPPQLPRHHDPPLLLTGGRTNPSAREMIAVDNWTLQLLRKRDQHARTPNRFSVWRSRPPLLLLLLPVLTMRALSRCALWSPTGWPKRRQFIKLYHHRVSMRISRRRP